jgi:hypothetical protein
LEAIVEVYVCEIQGVDFILKLGGIQDCTFFMVEDVVDVDSINSFVVEFEVKYVVA